MFSFLQVYIIVISL